MCRYYSASPISFQPTAIARAEKASDLKKYPHSALTQEKSDDRKGNRHWTEENATESEKDVSNRYELERKKLIRLPAALRQGG